MSQENRKFIDYLYVLIKWRKQILFNFFLVAIVSAIISLILPKEFKASATIVQTSEEEAGLSFGSLLSQLPLQGLGLGVSEESMLVMAIVNSRTIMEQVVNRFNLKERYKAKTMEEAVRELKKDVGLEVNDDGTLTLTTKARTGYFASQAETDSVRKLVSDMANFIVNRADAMNILLRGERAGNTRIFLEKRYLQNLEDLAGAEEKFKSFQEKYGAISLPEQTAATIKVAAQLKARIIEQQIKVHVLENYVGNTHAEYLAAMTELRELQNKYKKFAADGEDALSSYNNKQQEMDPFLPLRATPELGLEYFRLLREVKIQEKIMEFLLPQYEQAKIQETKDTAILQVIDEAVPPVKRNKPKRAFFVLFWSFLCLFISSYIFLSVESFKSLKIRSPEQYQKYQAVYDYVRSDMRKIFKRN